MPTPPDVKPDPKLEQARTLTECARTLLVEAERLLDETDRTDKEPTK